MGEIQECFNCDRPLTRPRQVELGCCRSTQACRRHYAALFRRLARWGSIDGQECSVCGKRLRRDCGIGVCRLAHPDEYRARRAEFRVKRSSNPGPSAVRSSAPAADAPSQGEG